MLTIRGVGRKNRGVALVLALFFMILLSMIGIALIAMVPVELQSSTRTKLDLQAHYAVTSGVRHASTWCSAVMTPSTGGSSDYLGDPGSNTTGNNFYPTNSSSYVNEVTGVDGDNPEVEYRPMRLSQIWSNGGIPTGTSRWNDVYEMLNIPQTGLGAVNGNTVCLVQKAPLTLGDWTSYNVIIPDSISPGGAQTLDANGKISTFFGGSGSAGKRCYQVISIAFYQGFPTLRGKSTLIEDSFGRYSLFVNKDATNGGWVLQALPKQSTTLGPVHTNEYFRFAINPGVWNNDPAAGDAVAFNGLLTYGRAATAADGAAPGLNHDGALYSEGNDQRGTLEDYRPFNSSGGEIGSRYSKMIAGGKSNLRQTQPVQLPPDSTKLSRAAYGSEYSTSLYKSSDPTLTKHIGSTPDGIFVFPNGNDGKAGGGIVVKGDSSRMFLEVVDGKGRPQGVDLPNASGTLVASANAGELTGLEDGTLPGNPAVRIQASSSVTGKATGMVTTSFTSVVTTGTTSTSSVASTVSVVTTGSTSTSTVSRTSTPTTTGSTVRVTSTSTGVTRLTTGSSVSTSTRTLFGTSFIPTTSTITNSSVVSSVSTRITTVTTSTSRVTSSTSTTGYTTVGGAGGIVQALTTVFPVTSWSTFSSASTLTTTIPVSTVYSTSLSSTTRTSSSSTGVSLSITTVPLTTRSTLFSTFTTTSPLTTLVTFSTTIYGTFPLTSRTTLFTTTFGAVPLTSTTTVATSYLDTNIPETWKPIDQVIEVRSGGLTLGAGMFHSSGTNVPTMSYQRPAGAHGKAADMDVSKLSKLSTFIVMNGSVPSTYTAVSGGSSQSFSVPDGNVVVMRQSRDNPHTAMVFIIPSTPNKEGSLLNGAVFSEGNIGDEGKPGEGIPGTGGLAGVNKGRKTIGTHIKVATPPPSSGIDPEANDTDLFGIQPRKEDEVSVGIVNNLWQYGTKRYENDPKTLKADNGLGIVSQDVRLTAEPGITDGTNPDPEAFTTFWGSVDPKYDGSQRMLNIHAVILAGTSAGEKGGLTANGFQDINYITPSALKGTTNNTPLVRFVGGLIVQNYYARINALTGAGWNSRNLYNQQLANSPPPFFPNNGRLISLSYIEERIWSEQLR